MSKLRYAGIGSRKTPEDILHMMTEFAFDFADDAILCSGGCAGADKAFELGVALATEFYPHPMREFAEIYWPWPDYGAVQDDLEWGWLLPILDDPISEAYEVAERFHPAWHACKQGARRLHARNAHIILGEDLSNPVDLVLCWTPDGSLDGSGSRSGGTGQALRMAADWDIEVRNLQEFSDWAETKLAMEALFA